jgi:CHAD domain-containing protein
MDKPKNTIDKEINLEALQGYVAVVLPEDNMAESGRKILLKDFVQMLEREGGSRTGEDIEDVHKMRVATRRMRTAFKLFQPYYKVKSIRPFMKMLKKAGTVLGTVRDLDVMIEELTNYQATTDEAGRAAIQGTIIQLDNQRVKARGKLIKFLDGSDYRKFVLAFSKFLVKKGKGARPIADGIAPYQVRHVVPVVVNSYLADVCAYDTVLNGETEPETFHTLRIEFKRLRYTVSHFGDVLGVSAGSFVDEIKIMQDHLGRMNDFVVARDRLSPLLDGDVLDNEQKSALQSYLDSLAMDKNEHIETFSDAWQRFNSRTSRRMLYDALLKLR